MLRADMIETSINETIEIFKDRGWKVYKSTGLPTDGFNFDLLLYDEDDLVGGIDVKYFISESFSERIVRPLFLKIAQKQAMANCLINLKFEILYVNNEAFLISLDKIITLSSIPTPNNYQAYISYAQESGTSAQEVASQINTKTYSAKPLISCSKHFLQLSQNAEPKMVSRYTDSILKLRNEINFPATSAPSKSTCEAIEKICINKQIDEVNLPMLIKKRFQYIRQNNKNSCTEKSDDWLIQITSNNDEYNIKKDSDLWYETLLLVRDQIITGAKIYASHCGLNIAEDWADYEDIKSELIILECVKLPDYHCKYKCTTYLNPSVKNMINLIISEKTEISRYIAGNRKKVKEAIDSLNKKGNKNPTNKAIADEANWIMATKKYEAEAQKYPNQPHLPCSDSYKEQRIKSILFNFKSKNLMTEEKVSSVIKALPVVSYDEYIDNNPAFEISNESHYSSGFFMGPEKRAEKNAITDFISKINKSQFSDFRLYRIFDIYRDYYTQIAPANTARTTIKGNILPNWPSDLPNDYIIRQLKEKYGQGARSETIDLLKLELKIELKRFLKNSDVY